MRLLEFHPKAVAALILAVASGAAACGEVDILGAEFRSDGGDRWSIAVTLRHADTGWDHYADAWRVVDGEGAVLGERVLLHPHVDEQPFERSLNGVRIPSGTRVVYVEARDTVHGLSPNRLEVDLGQAKEGRLVVERGE
jgi:hypothetical protein